MSQETFRLHVEDVWMAGWVAEYPTYPLLFENLNKQQPDTPWAQIVIDDSLHASRTNIGRKSRRKRTGLIVISLYVPEESGTRILNQMHDTVDSIFAEKSWTLSDGDVVVTKIPRTNDWGQHSIKEGYYERRLFIDFSRTECV